MTLSASEKGPERVFRYEETFLVLDLTTMLLLLNIFLPCQVPERLEANKQALSSLWRDANQGAWNAPVDWSKQPMPISSHTG